MNANEIAARINARRSGRCPCPYPFLLVYSQEFTSGTLAGIVATYDLPFCSEADAQTWVTKINAKEARGANPYRVVEHAVVAL